jgi:uncharacterized SAM-binding protein YcdF (DUF218 family)
VILDLVTGALQRPLRVADPFEKLDAIVVLGSPLTPSGELSTVLAERVDAAAALYHRGGAPLVVATGGKTRGARRSEADAIAEGLVATGVHDLFVEDEALTTADNARLTAELLLPSARRIWLVTQPFHGRRAALLFRRAGFEPHVWHIESSVQYADRARALKWIVREYGAWAALAVRDRRR